MTDTDRIVRELADREAIRDLIARYCHGIDRCDVEEIRSCYHEDSHDNHGMFQGNGHDFAEFIVPLMLEHYETCMHAIHNHQATIDGDRASAETYCVTYSVRRVDDTKWFDQFGCRYVDQLERRDGEWKILDRVVVHEWDTSSPVGQMQDTSAFQHGRRDRTDLSYRS